MIHRIKFFIKNGKKSKFFKKPYCKAQALYSCFCPVKSKTITEPSKNRCIGVYVLYINVINLYKLYISNRFGSFLPKKL